MTKEEAISIAQNWIDSSDRIAKIKGAQWLEEWVLDANLNQVHHPVWVVFADNFRETTLEGNSEYNIVVSTETKKVEDVRMM